LVLLLALSALPGCGWKAEPRDERAERYPMTTPDSSGRPVVIPARPEAVVTTDAAAGSVLAALDPDAAVRSLPNAGPGALEDVAADLLVVSDRPGEPPAALADTTPVFRYGAARFDEVPDAVSRLGLAVGRGPEGVRLATDLARRLEAVRARGAAAPKVRVFIDAGALQTVDVNRPLARAVQLAGGTLIRTSPGPVSLVRLRRFDPQVWLVLPASGTRLALLRRRDDTKGIDAVRTGRVVPVREVDYAPDMRLPAKLDALIDLLHRPAS
jgi:ABC-type Fe3+-hydroxamate transport system substrate-binding protein